MTWHWQDILGGLLGSVLVLGLGFWSLGVWLDGGGMADLATGAITLWLGLWGVAVHWEVWSWRHWGWGILAANGMALVILGFFCAACW